MNIDRLTTMFADAAPAGTQPNPMAGNFQTLSLVVIMFVFMYLFMIRPQQKKAKEHAAMLKTVKSGDKILTSGGIIGFVITVKEKTLTIRSADTKMEITKSAIAEITERGEEKPAPAT